MPRPAGDRGRGVALPVRGRREHRAFGPISSNHPDLREDVELFNVPCHHVPVEKDPKPDAEAKQLELLDGCCDLVVLARYMQVLSPEFLDRVGVPIIEQNVVRVSHRDDVGTLAQQGADVERLVLARAVQAHCEDRVLRHGNTTVVF